MFKKKAVLPTLIPL